MREDGGGGISMVSGQWQSSASAVEEGGAFLTEGLRQPQASEGRICWRMNQTREEKRVKLVNFFIWVCAPTQALPLDPSRVGYFFLKKKKHFTQNRSNHI